MMKLSIYKIISMQVAIVLLGILALSFAKKANADVTTITTGVFYIDGQSDTINSDDVSAFSIPLLISHKQDKFTFGVALSHLSVESGSIDEKGMGDTTLSVGYDVTDAFKISLKEKLATGDEEKGLSTGKNDTSIQLDYFSPLKDNKSSIFATVGHKFVGKKDGLNLQDVSYSSIGTGYIYNNKTSVGVSLDYRESIFSNLDNQLGLSAFINQTLNDTYSLSAFAGYDNTQTGSIGVSLTGKF